VDETLTGALAALFKDTVPPRQVPQARASAPLTGPAIERAQQALKHYQQAMEQLRTGDWSGFGSELSTLQRILEELSQPSEAR
jgi:uncharacterized membrane protein (UPF0182 family)